MCRQRKYTSLIMSDEEMEKFEITDYDLDNEFNMYRNRKGLSKQQQIYGKLTTFGPHKFSIYFKIIF